MSQVFLVAWWLFEALLVLILAAGLLTILAGVCGLVVVGVGSVFVSARHAEWQRWRPDWADFLDY